METVETYAGDFRTLCKLAEDIEKVESMKITSKRLKNSSDPKSILLVLGFRPVGRGEIPEHGDEIFNGNVLYDKSKRSATTFEHAVVHRPSVYNDVYRLHYTTTDYQHTYSKSWFEKVMWIRKKQRTDKPTEQKMAEERADYMVGTCIYTNTTETAMDEVLRGLSNGQAGKTFTCYKLVPVAVACKPVEPKQVQWL